MLLLAARNLTNVEYWCDANVYRVPTVSGFTQRLCIIDSNSCFNGNHWVATILYYRHQQGVMHEFIVNSLYSGESSSTSTNSVVKDIFLAYRVKYFANINIDWKQYNIKCTQQTTGYDCGLFTIGEWMNTLILIYFFNFHTLTN